MSRESIDAVSGSRMLFGYVNLRIATTFAKQAVLIAAMVSVSMIRANASLDPGAAMMPSPVPAPAFFLFAQSGSATTTPLPFSIATGDVILLKSNDGGIDTGNWAEVLEFQNVNGHGLATVYDLADYTGFVLDSSKTGSIKYVLESSDSPVTSYTPQGNFAEPQALGFGNPNSGSESTYNLNTLDSLAAVPETPTLVAGVLLLFPFGLSLLRCVHKTRRA